MRAFRVVATIFLIATISLAKYYQPGDSVIEKLVEIELKRDAYKYGKKETTTETDIEPIVTEGSEENTVAKKVHQARAVFIAYALKNGFDSEIATYFGMWFVASFGFIAILNWTCKKMAAKDMDKKEKDKIMGEFGEVKDEKKENLVGEL